MSWALCHERETTHNTSLTPRLFLSRYIRRSHARAYTSCFIQLNYLAANFVLCFFYIILLSVRALEVWENDFATCIYVRLRLSFVYFIIFLPQLQFFFFHFVSKIKVVDVYMYNEGTHLLYYNRRRDLRKKRKKNITSSGSRVGGIEAKVTRRTQRARGIGYSRNMGPRSSRRDILRQI